MNSRTRSLCLLLAIVVALVGVYGYRAWSEHAVSAAEREQLFQRVEAVFAKGDAQAPEISSLVAGLHKLDNGSPQVAMALGQIELLRGRYEIAAKYLEPLVVVGGSPAELRLAARTWLGWQLVGGRDHNERQSLLRQALRYAEGAIAAEGEVGDVFLAWQAAVRLGEMAMAQQQAEMLRQRFAGSREERTVARIDSSADLGQPLGPVEALLAEWAEPPIELRLMHAVLLLQNGAVDRATKLIDALLAEAPNLVEVRNFAATAHHMAGLLVSAGPERDRHLSLRDAQIHWLDANADPGDPRRSQWLAMLQER